MPADRPKELVEEGFRRRMSGDDVGAARAWAEALSLDPSNAQAREGLQALKAAGVAIEPIPQSPGEMASGGAFGPVPSPGEIARKNPFARPERIKPFNPTPSPFSDPVSIPTPLSLVVPSGQRPAPDPMKIWPAQAEEGEDGALSKAWVHGRPPGMSVPEPSSAEPAFDSQVTRGQGLPEGKPAFSLGVGCPPRDDAMLPVGSPFGAPVEGEAPRAETPVTADAAIAPTVLMARVMPIEATLETSETLVFCKPEVDASGSSSPGTPSPAGSSGFVLEGDEASPVTPLLSPSLIGLALEGGRALDPAAFGPPPSSSTKFAEDTLGFEFTFPTDDGTDPAALSPAEGKAIELELDRTESAGSAAFGSATANGSSLEGEEPPAPATPEVATPAAEVDESFSFSFDEAGGPPPGALADVPTRSVSPPADFDLSLEASLPDLDTLSAPPTQRAAPPLLPTLEEPARSENGDSSALLLQAVDLLDLDDYSGAMATVEKVLAFDPSNATAQEFKRRCEGTLVSMYESKLGDLTRRPSVRLKPDEIVWLNLDHRAGFLLSQIDGQSSLDDLFALSGMSRLETARILLKLLQDKVIA